jgi:predicted Zn-dependent peptidase
LISDILSNGDSSRLYSRLVKEQHIFSDIQAYITGDIDEGLFVFTGKLVKGISMEDADKAIELEINDLAENYVENKELEKVKNKIESTIEFSEMNVLNKAMNLSYSELLGDAGLINQEKERYTSVTARMIRNTSEKLFRQNNCSTLHYFAS